MPPPPLRKIAAREGIPVGTIEKDYTLSIVLSLLSKNPLVDSLVFKGGTAIKKIYFPGARFSEDLDFNFLGTTSKKIEDRINDLLIGKKIGDVEFLEMKNINHTDISFTCDISFIGQLQFRNKIKLDFSGRETPILDVKSPLIKTYDMQIKIPTLDLTEILAEKIRALTIRGKPRDLYDVWFLLDKNVEADSKLINQKLKLYNKKFEFSELMNSISNVRKNWERDLIHLLSVVPEFDIVSKKIIEKFKPTLVESLMNPSVYDEKISSVKLLQTHISWIFLTGRFAYKVKKPVNFEFLDFSTLKRRRFFCEEELRVNRRLCPDLYIGVVPIRKKGDEIKINGPGKVVEYAVKMRELPQDRMMDRLLQRNEITEEIIDKIAGILAEFHQKADTGRGINQYGSIKMIKANWDQNFEQTKELRGNVIESEMFDEIRERINGFMENNHQLFEDRIKNRRIRECHGDVHSGNIFVVDNRVYIFDAIEFNKAFSCSDVAAEIAFLAMDLDFHGRRDFSEFFVGRYIEYSGDRELKNLLEFYKCYRAYVRGKVISFRLMDKNITPEEKLETKELCKKYFDLAYEYAKGINI